MSHWGVLGEMDIPKAPTWSLPDLAERLRTVCRAAPGMTVEATLAADDGTPVSFLLERLIAPLDLMNGGSYLDRHLSPPEIGERLSFDFSPRQAAWQLRRLLSRGLAYRVYGDRQAAHALAPEVVALLGPDAGWRANFEAYERQPDDRSSRIRSLGGDGLTDATFSVGLVGAGNGYQFAMIVEDED